MIKPCADKVLLKRILEEKTDTGLLWIPTNVKERGNKCEVIAVGQGALMKNNTRLPVDFKVGDIVLIHPRTQVHPMSHLAEPDHIMVNHADIMVILESVPVKEEKPKDTNLQNKVVAFIFALLLLTGSPAMATTPTILPQLPKLANSPVPIYRVALVPKIAFDSKDVAEEALKSFPNREKLEDFYLFKVIEDSDKKFRLAMCVRISFFTKNDANKALYLLMHKENADPNLLNKVDFQIVKE